MTSTERQERFRAALLALDAKQRQPEPRPVCNVLQAIAWYLGGVILLTSPLWARWIWGN